MTLGPFETQWQLKLTRCRGKQINNETQRTKAVSEP